MSAITTQFYVLGMKDDSCIATANQALAVLEGFVSATFDVGAGVAVVTGDVDPQGACQMLAEAGYPAVVKSA